MALANFGIIAEIISAFAIVVTLAYLAIQTRHANKLRKCRRVSTWRRWCGKNSALLSPTRSCS